MGGAVAAETDTATRCGWCREGGKGLWRHPLLRRLTVGRIGCVGCRGAGMENIGLAWLSIGVDDPMGVCMGAIGIVAEWGIWRRGVYPPADDSLEKQAKSDIIYLQCVPMPPHCQ